MAEKGGGGRKRTGSMGAFGDDDPPDDKGPRGLAAFEKKAAGGGSGKGSARWAGGGGGDAQPKPGRAHEDQELLKDRISAHEIPEDDDMVAVSGLDWVTAMQSGGKPGKKGRGGEASAAAEEEGEERPRSKKAWWIVGGVLLLGGGGAAAAIALTSGAGTPASAPEATTEVATREDVGEEDAEEADATAAASGKEGDAGDAAAASADATADAGRAAEVPDDIRLVAVAAAPWAPAAEAKNPWVAIAAGPANQRLGLRDGELGDAHAGTRTGFLPGGLEAPTYAYRIQAHEVTWAELALADTVPALERFERPSWLPASDAKRAVLPATRVPWALARAYCRGLGGDLPSEAEWEWAARGADDRLFPWGRDALDGGAVRITAQGPVPVVAVGKSKQDRTPQPVVSDLLGNAQEWTRNAWRAADPAAKPDARRATHRAVRGWPLADPGASIPAEGSTYRTAGCADAACIASEGGALERIGFRCVASAP